MEDFIESLKQRSRQLEIESQYLREMASQMDIQRNIDVPQNDSTIFTPVFQQQQNNKDFIASPIVRVKIMKPNSSDFNPFTNGITVLSKVHHVTTIPSKLLQVHAEEQVITETEKVQVKEASPTPQINVSKEEVSTVIKEDVPVVKEEDPESVVKETIPVIQETSVQKQVEPKMSSLLSKRVNTTSVPKKKQTFYVPKLSVTPEKKIVPQINPTKPEPFIRANTVTTDSRTKVHSIKARLPKMSFVADAIESEDVIPERITSHFMRPKIMRPRNFIYPITDTSDISDITEKFPSILPKYLPERVHIDHKWIEVDQGPLAVSGVFIFAMYHEYLFKVVPSALGLYYASRSKEDKTFDVGANLYTVLQAYKNNGFVPESFWEWNPDMFHMEPVVPKTMEPYTLNIYRLNFDHEIQKCIKDSRPVMISMTIFSDLLEYSNVINIPPVDEQPIGTQCFLIVGYDRQTQVYSCLTSLHKTVPGKIQFSMEYIKTHAVEMFVAY